MADALPADVLIVPADGVPFGLLRRSRADDPGVTRTPVVSLDMTRQLCDLTLDNVAGQADRRRPAGEPALAAALRPGAGMLAAEQLGLAERALEITLAYVKQRYQFARPVGSFQALKHRFADWWVAVTQARAARRYAAACLADGDPDTPVAVALAKSAVLGHRRARRPGDDPAARRHRLHLGAPGAPVPQARQEHVAGARHRRPAPRHSWPASPTSHRRLPSRAAPAPPFP